jgi:hypothetical protein
MEIISLRQKKITNLEPLIPQKVVEAISKERLTFDGLDVLKILDGQNNWKCVYENGKESRDYANLDHEEGPVTYWTTYFGHKNAGSDSRATVKNLLMKVGMLQYKEDGKYEDPRAQLLLVPPIETKKDWKGAQAFVTGRNESICSTHYDKTDSLLLVLRGSKWFKLKPPGKVKSEETQEDFSGESPHTDGESSKNGWIDVHLASGEGLLIPRNWWHSVKSEPGTVALSLVIRINNG